MKLFDNKRVLVVGGASGIGLATAKKYLEYNAKVAVMDVNKDKLNDMANLASRNQYLSFYGDVREQKDIKHVIQEMKNEWNGIDIFIYSAGIFPDRLLLEMSEDEWNNVMDINAKGAFLCCQAVANHMVEQGTGGSIVTVSSGSYQTARVGSGHYCASKAALVMLTKVLAMELAEHQIMINSIAPGLVENPVLSEQYIESFKKQIPLGRIGKADDIASSILMITSDFNTFITGQVIGVDGGTTAGRYGLPMSNK